MERVAGIEPASSAWKAEVLPLNYTRGTLFSALLYSLVLLNYVSQLLYIDVAPAISLSRNTARPAQNAVWWWGKDSNLRRRSRQIYSLIPLTAWVPHQRKARNSPTPYKQVNGLYKPQLFQTLTFDQPNLVPPPRVELGTSSLQVRRSTN